MTSPRSWRRKRSRRDATNRATPMVQPWPLDRWPDVPNRYLVCRDDRFHPAAWARGMVRDRLDAEADEIGGSHSVYLSRPRELAERLDSYLPASASAA